MVLNLNASKSREIVNIYKNQMQLKLKEIDSLGLILKTFRTDYNLLDMEAQVQKYTEAITNGRSLEESRKVLDNWREYGSEFHKTDSLFYYALKDYRLNKEVYDNALRDANKVQTYSHVISNHFS